MDEFWDDILGKAGRVSVKWCLKGLVKEALQGRGDVWNGCKSVGSEEEGPQGGGEMHLEGGEDR